MLPYIGRRVAQAIPLLVLLSVLVFALIHAVPGGPLAMYLENPNVRPQDIERLRHALGLDRPLVEQYAAWLRGFVAGDWGYSFADGRAVTARVAERLPATLQLLGGSIVVAIAAAVPLGVVTAARRGGAVDRVATAASAAGISIPVFWLGLVLQLVFAVALGWLPSSGRSTFGAGGVLDVARHLVLPATVLAAVYAAAWSRYLRASVGDALAQRYVVAALGRGVPSRVVLWRHALRNALGPFVAVVCLDAAIMVSGAVVTESVFAWPGIGSLFTESLARRDYTVLMALLMLSATAVIVLNLVADVVHRALDPRVGT
jgi:peptide/nickel transport system permease protein